MKAWDDNSVTETGTAHDGRFTTMVPSLSFLGLLSTVPPYFPFLLTVIQSVFWCHPKVPQILFLDLISWRNMLMLFLIGEMKVLSCLFIIPIFNSAIYWRKEIRKINLCLFWQRDGRPVVWEILQFRVKRKKDKEIKGNMRKDVFLRSTARNKDKAIMWLYLQNPATKKTYEAHPWWPTGTNQWLQWSGDDTYKTADLFKNANKLLAQ